MLVEPIAKIMFINILIKTTVIPMLHTSILIDVEYYR